MGAAVCVSSRGPSAGSAAFCANAKPKVSDRTSFSYSRRTLAAQRNEGQDDSKFYRLGVITRPSSGRCHDLVEEIRLLGSEEMVRLFPSSELRVEEFLGFQKSLIALQE